MINNRILLFLLIIFGNPILSKAQDCINAEDTRSIDVLVTTQDIVRCDSMLLLSFDSLIKSEFKSLHRRLSTEAKRDNESLQIDLQRIDSLKQDVFVLQTALNQQISRQNQQIEILIEISMSLKKKVQKVSNLSIVLLVLIILISVLYIYDSKHKTIIPLHNTECAENIEKKDVFDNNLVVAYDDAIQTFVNINDYIYNLRRYNSLISPYICWFASNEGPCPEVSLDSLTEEEKSKVTLLVTKIMQFKKYNEKAINTFLKCASNNKSYADCIRYPFNAEFDSEQDQHLLGDNIINGEKIKAVYKLGFFFPHSSKYPYLEKSLVL